jgi:hypothetical protein
MAAAPDTACVDLLDGTTTGTTTLTRGTNLFSGPVRATQLLGTDIPDVAVFCLATGSVQNDPYIGVDTALRRKTVQIMCRGPRNNVAEAEALGVLVIETLDRAQAADFPGSAPTGYIDTRTDGHPNYLGPDGNNRYEYSVNALMRITE